MYLTNPAKLLEVWKRRHARLRNKHWSVGSDFGFSDDTWALFGKRQQRPKPSVLDTFLGRQESPQPPPPPPPLVSLRYSGQDTVLVVHLVSPFPKTRIAASKLTL